MYNHTVRLFRNLEYNSVLQRMSSSNSSDDVMFPDVMFPNVMFPDVMFPKVMPS